MRRLHLPAAAVAFAAALALAACGPPQPADESPAIGADPTSSASPAPPVVPTPKAVPSPSPPVVAQPTAKPAPAPQYPTTAKAYAEAVVAAWQQNQIGVLGNLATAGVQEQIIEIPGPINMDWTYLRCDGTAGSSYCMFINAIGDVLTLRISHLLLGKAHAAIEVRLDAKA